MDNEKQYGHHTSRSDSQRRNKKNQKTIRYRTMTPIDQQGNQKERKNYIVVKRLTKKMRREGNLKGVIQELQEGGFGPY